MLPVFYGVRPQRLALLALVALAQLGCVLLVVRSLHQLRDPAMLAAAALACFGLEVLLRRLCEEVGLAHATAVRLRLFRHLMSADVELVRRRRHGAMLQSFVGDLTALRQFVSEGIMRAGLAGLSAAILLGWMVLLEPASSLRLGVLAVFCAALLAALRPALRAKVAEVRKERGRVAAFASDRLAASATVQASGRIESEASRLARIAARLNAAALSRATLLGLLRAMPHLTTTAMLAVIVFSDAARPHGDTAALLIVAGLLGLALRDLARAVELEVPGQISRERIAVLLAVPVPESAPASRADSGRGKLVLDEVVVERVRLDLHYGPGAVVLVDGEPALRRRLFSVLAGVAAPDAGEVRLDRRAVLSLSPGQRRKLLGWASPDLPLLAGSVAFNLRYRSGSADKLALEELAGEWQLDFAARTGDPARIVLVRALAGQPLLLLLDLSDNALGADDVKRLAAVLADWPGIVVIASEQPALRASATARLPLAQRNEPRLRLAVNSGDAL